MENLGLHLMNFEQINEVFNEHRIVLIPMGSMEQHGSHSINGDYLAATEVAERISKKLKLPYLPTVPFGNSNYFRNYPGTITLREETVTAIVTDIIKSLLEHNQKHLVFVNGHAGNKSSINNAVRKLKEEHDDLDVITLNLWQLLSSDQKKSIYKSDIDPSGHGAEPLSSIMRFLYPENVDSSRENFGDSKLIKNNIEILNLNESSLNGLPFSVYFDMEDIATDGRYSREFEPDKVKGEKLLNAIEENAIKIIKQYYEV